MLAAVTAGLAGAGLTASMSTDRVPAQAAALPAASVAQVQASVHYLAVEQALFTSARQQAALQRATIRAEALAARQAAAKARAAAVTSRSQARPPLSPTAARQLGLSLAAAAGYSQAQVSCLDSLWTRESGWKVTAQNPSSGAYGIPQALPGWKMSSVSSDWRTNARTQILWGLSYIKSSYGTACSALSHARGYGWY